MLLRYRYSCSPLCSRTVGWCLRCIQRALLCCLCSCSSISSSNSDRVLCLVGSGKNWAWVWASTSKWESQQQDTEAVACPCSWCQPIVPPAASAAFVRRKELPSLLSWYGKRERLASAIAGWKTKSSRFAWKALGVSFLELAVKFQGWWDWYFHFACWTNIKSYHP